MGTLVENFRKVATAVRDAVGPGTSDLQRAFSQAADGPRPLGVILPGVKNTVLTYADLEGKEQTRIAKAGDLVMPGMKVEAGAVYEQKENFGNVSARLIGETRIRTEDGSTISLGDQASFKDGVVTGNTPRPSPSSYSAVLGIRG